MTKTSTNLLIGGSGFIGSFLSKELIAQGQKVVSVSSDPRGDAEGVESVTIDLNHDNCPEKLLNNATNVYILTGQVYPGFDQEQEKHTLAKLVKLLGKGSQSVVYFSTILVYGNTSQPATESSPLHPIDDYAQFKVAAESIIRDHIPEERLTIARLANVYGSPRNKGFIGLLMRKVAELYPKVILNGDGQQKRDYLFIDDLVRVLLVMQNKTQPGIINIATGESYTLIDVVNLVREISGRAIEQEITNSELSEVKNSTINNSLLKKVYGFSDFTTLREGLTKTLQRYQDNGKPF